MLTSTKLFLLGWLTAQMAITQSQSNISSRAESSLLFPNDDVLLKQNGYWISNPKTPFHVWQYPDMSLDHHLLNGLSLNKVPKGHCDMSGIPSLPLTRQTSAFCYDNTRILFIGDSTARTLFYTWRTALNPFNPTEEDTERHSDKHWFYQSSSTSSAAAHTKEQSPPWITEMTFLWDPYFNRTTTLDILKVDETTPVRNYNALFIGIGLWSIAYDFQVDRFDFNKFNSTTVSPLMNYLSKRHKATKQQQLQQEKLWPTIIIPLLPPCESLLAPHRNHITTENVNKMNKLFQLQFQQLHPSVVIPTSWYDMAYQALAIAPSMATEDGVHYNSKFAQSQLSTLLNAWMPSPSPSFSFSTLSVAQSIVFLGLFWTGPLSYLLTKWGKESINAP